MTFDSNVYCRKSIRLKHYDYASAGCYFITIAAHERAYLFGDIVDGEMQMSPEGQIVEREWIKTAEIRENVELDRWIVMPNHFHAILILNGRGTARRAPTFEQFAKPVSGSVPTILRSFKSAVTKSVNELNNTPGQKLWQRNYWEHVIRNQASYDKISDYIANNPLNWITDELNMGK